VTTFELPEGVEPYDLATCLRKLGFAVVIFSPEELGHMNPDELEDLLVSRGNDILEQENQS